MTDRDWFYDLLVLVLYPTTGPVVFRMVTLHHNSQVAVNVS